MRRRQKTKYFNTLIFTLVLTTLTYYAWPNKAAAPAPSARSMTITAMAKNQPQRYSIENPSSIWVIVNKQHQLNPSNYIPGDLVFPKVATRLAGSENMKMRKIAALALEKMFSDAKSEGLQLMLTSGYRSYITQDAVYRGYVKTEGQVAADRFSARPGYSEHQTGLAADIEPLSGRCQLDVCFGDTDEGKWLAANSYEYGYILRYPRDKEAITGYQYEPWHLRFVGIDLASEMHGGKIETLEEFFDTSGGPSYR